MLIPVSLWGIQRDSKLHQGWFSSVLRTKKLTTHLGRLKFQFFIWRTINTIVVFSNLIAVRMNLVLGVWFTQSVSCWFAGASFGGSWLMRSRWKTKICRNTNGATWKAPSPKRCFTHIDTSTFHGKKSFCPSRFTPFSLPTPPTTGLFRSPASACKAITGRYSTHPSNGPYSCCRFPSWQGHCLFP